MDTLKQLLVKYKHNFTFDNHVVVNDNFYPMKKQYREWWVKRNIEHHYDTIISTPSKTNKFIEKLYRHCIETDIGRCMECDNLCAYLNQEKGFRETCSNTCHNKLQTKYSWWTNGVDVVNAIDPPSVGWYKGRSGEFVTQKDTIWVTDGVEDKRCNIDAIPAGFNKGRIAKTTQNTTWLVDDNRNRKLIKVGDEIPDGFYANNMHDKETFLKYYKGKSVTEIISMSRTNHIQVYKKIKEFGLTSMYGIKQNASNMEVDLINKLNYDGVVIQSDRKTIRPKELDILIPDKKLAIEMNGVYWHSNKYKENNYHLNKTNRCEDKDIQLLHIFDCEWAEPSKQEIWKSLINNKLGLSRRIFARKCELKEIQSKERNQFLKANHLQGADKANHSFGLFYENELVAVMSFIKSRFNKAFKWELSRFCCLNGVSIVGGASRLLTAFRRLHSSTIISYANRRWSEGGLYRALGFTELEPTKPNYFYFKAPNPTLHSRQKFQKHKLEKQLEHFDSTMTEWQNMEANGWLKVYDSGNRVFVLTESLCKNNKSSQKLHG